MTPVDGKSEPWPSSEKLVTVNFNSSTLISRRVGGGGGGAVGGVRTNPLYRSVMAEEKALKVIPSNCIAHPCCA